MSVVDRRNGTFSISCDVCGKFIKMDDVKVSERVAYSTEPPYSEPEMIHMCKKCYEEES